MEKVTSSFIYPKKAASTLHALDLKAVSFLTHGVEAWHSVCMRRPWSQIDALGFLFCLC